MLHDITQKVYNKGDKVIFVHDGQIFSGVVKQTSCIQWEREYLVVFEDGSSRWAKVNEFVKTLS